MISSSHVTAPAVTAASTAASSVLEVRDLTTVFSTPDGEVTAADRVGFSIRPGESLGVVGESGSGKTQVFLSVMGLLARNGRSTGSVRYRGREILNLPPARLNEVRGEKIAMIFQDPMTSLNPFLSVGRQMSEVLEEHRGLGHREAIRRAAAMLERVGIPEPGRRLAMYPHQLSGGMRQRVMIAMALLCDPDLLIADEPTTALDVTVQAQILHLLRELQQELGMAMALVTHDLGVVAGACDRVVVMYGGRIAETATTRELFARPCHPYTQGLLGSMPRLDEARTHDLTVIPGQPPNLQALPPGCPFTPRCPHTFERCPGERPLLRELNPARAPGRAMSCHLEVRP